MDSATAAFDDLQTGSLSQTGYNELIVLVRRVMDRPSNQAFVADLSIELGEPGAMVAELAQRGSLHSVAQRSVDAEAFTRQLVTATKNMLIDLHRKTEAGALAQRVMEKLRRADQLSLVRGGANQGRWTSVAVPATNIWNGDEGTLINAVWDLEIEPVTEWEGDRRTPVCSGPDLVRILETIIGTANAPLPASQIVRVVRHRFKLLSIEPQRLNDAALFAGSSRSAEDEAIAAIEAQETALNLTPEELVILSSPNANAAELAELLDCSQSTAWTRRNRFQEHLELLGWTEERDPSSNTGDTATGDHS